MPFAFRTAPPEMKSSVARNRCRRAHASPLTSNDHNRDNPPMSFREIAIFIWTSFKQRRGACKVSGFVPVALRFGFAAIREAGGHA